MDTTQKWNTPWTVTYTDPAGNTKTTTVIWRDIAPTLHDVALSIRDELLGENPWMVDMSRNKTEDPEIYRLRFAGFVIVKIERAVNGERI